MKFLAMLLLATISLHAAAQTKTNSETTNAKQSISDNGKKLHIVFKSNQNGKSIDYDRTFNVKGMSKTQKDALIKRITDSLSVR